MPKRLGKFELPSKLTKVESALDAGEGACRCDDPNPRNRCGPWPGKGQCHRGCDLCREAQDIGAERCNYSGASEKIAAKAYESLAKGGRAITMDFIPEPDRITPPSTAGFALTMLATTAHGDAYTFAEYQQLFAKATFSRSEFHALPPTMQQAVVSFKG